LPEKAEPANVGSPRVSFTGLATKGAVVNKAIMHVSRKFMPKDLSCTSRNCVRASRHRSRSSGPWLPITSRLIAEGDCDVQRHSYEQARFGAPESREQKSSVQLGCEKRCGPNIKGSARERGTLPFVGAGGVVHHQLASVTMPEHRPDCFQPAGPTQGRVCSRDFGPRLGRITGREGGRTWRDNSNDVQVRVVR
jgi:hypothetical protein